MEVDVYFDGMCFKLDVNTGGFLLMDREENESEIKTYKYNIT